MKTPHNKGSAAAGIMRIMDRVSHFYKTKMQSPTRPEHMYNKVIIFLSTAGFANQRETTAEAAWVITDPLGAVIKTVTQGDLAQLQPAPEEEVLVIVPAHEILLTQTALPRLNPYRLQQALPYALEEQVLDELELLHFAPGPYQGQLKATGQSENTPHLPVAIVKKNLMQQWLDLLQKNGIQPSHIIPVIFALPYHKNQWQLLITPSYATVRTGLYSGFSTELQNIETLLALKLEETESQPEKLIIYHDKNQDFYFNAITINTEKIGLNAAEKLALAASALAKCPYLNLMQAPYATARKLKVPEKNKKAWQLAATAFVFWLGLLFCSNLGSWLILAYEHHHLQNLMQKTYQAHFAQAPALNPQEKLTAKLKKMLAQHDRFRFFQWLGYLAHATSTVRIQSLNFQNNQLSIELIAPSFSSLDELVLSLKSDGVEVVQQNATLLGSQIKAVLLITGKAT